VRLAGQLSDRCVRGDIRGEGALLIASLEPRLFEAVIASSPSAYINGAFGGKTDMRANAYVCKPDDFDGFAEVARQIDGLFVPPPRCCWPGASPELMTDAADRIGQALWSSL
jgi:hypothetical protein